MKLFKKWAEREYSLPLRIFASLLAGLLFAFLFPYVLARVAPVADRKLGLPSIGYGTATWIAGGILLLIGLIYALWSILAQLFRARGTPLPMMATQKLLVSGPFRQCRNPMTFGTILLYLGIGIIAGSITAVAAVLLFAALLVLYIKAIEEKELEARFGEEYQAYKKQTPFLIPRLWPPKS
ncbi:MAG: isoprenylcysteine carboxylmethyltransferase family protein [Anaerolineales bacterium]|jgi:protein-S-isoprenylcysteine O-methyltransferase Ste14